MHKLKFDKLLKSQTATMIRFKHLIGDITLNWEQFKKIKELYEVEMNEKRMCNIKAKI